ncbi:hypothetical protein P152DRAFT_474797 [Eremomyces bilateralis CBS 781.70]|uniref:Uncharacterized protein n=1 Tax=Eremomyces bilateralis CBS 781.70 TaxID=1392243 RepID=A0A6G1FZT3_9PEZI|nr:uncharacterized protein P152DRAFT_474797 [Eremomyces bilateralis CBS 781.70]KAF1811180.1 hypothetical protein P152DRAFT_474797 [Eremomyces bilateralis CBS 781.70]
MSATASATNACPAPAPTSSQSTEKKVKPCCVCTDEKSARDECMLFSQSSDPGNRECKDLVSRYRICMAGFGFQV